MKTSVFSKLPRYITDLAYPFSVEYAICVYETSLVLMRIGKASRIDVLYRSSGSDSSSVENFIKDIKEGGFYYGQPVSILVNNRRSWSYITRIVKTGMSDALERVRALSTPGVDCRHRVVRIKKNVVFAAQGIERSLLEQLTSACEAGGVHVAQITTLSIALLGALVGSEKSGVLHVFNSAEDGVQYLFDTGEQGILFGDFSDVTDSASIVSATERLVNRLSDTPQDISTVVYSSGAVTKGGTENGSLGVLLKKSLTYLPKLKGLTFSLEGSRFTAGLRVALNSARLLTWIFAAAFVLAGFSAALTGIAASGDDELIDVYQRHYSDKMSLELELESLQKERATLGARGSGSVHNSAVVSAFCQRGLGSVHLNRILIRNAAGDSSLVELTGSARNEASIFRYHELLSQTVEPFRLSINAIQPEVTSSRGGADTTLTFKFSMKVDVEKR